MAEQMRASEKQTGRRRRIRTGQSEQHESNDDQRNENVGEELTKLDAAFDEYLADTSRDEIVVAGQQQSHLLSSPLSNEALVRGFRQTRGE
jgi:hypothetical protein